MATTISGTSGVTFPAGGTGNTAGTVVGTTDTQTLTNKTLSGATWTSPSSSTITSGTAQNSTSGTSIDFTGIPSWVKRITVMFSGVSTSGSNNFQIHLGTGAGPTYTTSGYGSVYNILGLTTIASSGASTGFVCCAPSSATAVSGGQVVITNITGNTWVTSGVIAETSGSRNTNSAGSIALGAVLTAVRITTVGGTDTFDAGTINILYE